VQARTRVQMGRHGVHQVMTIEAMKQALEALEQWNTPLYKRGASIETLRQAIAEAEKQPKREWAGLMRGVRVEGDTVVISVKGGNAAARELCGALIEEKNNG
jgi:hypothetical protein